MSERFVFPVRYESAAMRAAVNAFTTRALFLERPAHTLAPLVLLGLSCVMLGFADEAEDAIMLFFGALGLLALFALGGWRMHQRTLREKVEAARGHISSARLYDDGLIIDAGGEAPMLRWDAIRAVWPAGQTLLLILAKNRFVALPIDRASQEAVDFLMAHAGAKPQGDRHQISASA